MSGKKINAFMLIIIIGIYILSQQSKIDKEQFSETNVNKNSYEGIFMIILAAFTQ